VRREFPILEFDPSPRATIEPEHVHKPIDIAEHCILCFFPDVLKQLHDQGKLKEIHLTTGEIGSHQIHEFEHAGRKLALMHPGVGGPLAAIRLEKAIALGCKKFIACGGAGVLDGSIAVGHVIVPTSAIRDEGTSYHYLPPSREVAPSADAVAAIERTLQRNGIEYLTGKTWTTDGVYRETPERIQMRKSEGALTVEMEAATFFAVAKFRDVKFAQILYGADDVSGEWDHRDWMKHSVREKLFQLAVEACLDI